MKKQTSPIFSNVFAFFMPSIFLLLSALTIVFSAEAPLNIIQTFGQEGKQHGVNSMAMHGNFLYTASDSNILYYRRDLTTGLLTYGGYIPSPISPCAITFAGDRLYTAFNNTSGIICYNIDTTTGKPVKSGVMVPCPPASHIIAGPDGKDLYIKSNAFLKYKIFVHYSLDSLTGKPTIRDTVTGSGLGYCSFGEMYPNMVMTRDGKYIYTIAYMQEMKIACIERKPTGQIVYKKATNLITANIDAIHRTQSYEWGGIAVTPDGKWFYAHFWAYTGYSALIVYRRNAETGELTFQSVTYETDNPIAGSKGVNIIFFPDGSGGFAGATLHHRFSIDSLTGNLTNIEQIPVLDYTSSLCLVPDFSRGLLYGGGGEGAFIWILKTDTVQDPYDVQENNISITSTQPRLTLSRNPVTGAMNVEASLLGYQGTGTLQLNDITGRVLFHSQFIDGKTGLPLSGLARGTYVVSAKTKEGKIFSAKMTLLK